MGRYLAYFSALFVIVPILIGCFKHSSLKNDLKLVFYLLLISLFMDSINIYMAESSINNMTVVNLFTIIEFTFLSLFYKPFYNSIYKISFYFIITPFIIFAIVNTVIVNDLTLYNSTLVTLEAIFFIILSCGAFYFILKMLLYEDLFQEPFFWINSAILIYFAGSTFFFGFVSFAQKYNPKALVFIFPIHSVLHIIYYALIGTGFWKARKA